MNIVFEKLLKSNWREGDKPYSIVNSEGYELVEDTGSWLMLIDDEGNRIWDYPVLALNNGWVCNTINRECEIHSKSA